METFLKKYFFDSVDIFPPAFHKQTAENEYIFRAKTGGLSRVVFPEYDLAYKPIEHIPNVSIFVSQIAAFKIFLIGLGAFEAIEKALKTALKENENPQDAETIMALGKLFCTIVYGQLIAEKAVELALDERLISLLFHQLIEDLNFHAIKINSLPTLGEGFGAVHKTLIRRMINSQNTKPSELEAALEMLEQGFAP
jgi:acyl-CoA dehydrogenase